MLKPAAITLAIIVCVAVLLLFISLGQYAWPAADDYCMATGVHNTGLLQHLWTHYLEWSGRYTGNTLYAVYPLIFGLLDGYSLIPLFVVILLWLGMAFLLSGLFRLSMFSGRVMLVSLVLVTVYMLGIRHPASSLYWMAGAMTYQSASILLLVMLGLMLRIIDRQAMGQRYMVLYSGLIVVTVLGIGTNEIGMLVILGIALLAFAFHLLKRNGRVKPWFVLFLVAMMFASVVVFSPGTAVRSATFTMAHDFTRSLQGSVTMGWWALKAWLGVPFMLIASLLTPVATAYLYQQSTRQFNVPGWLIAVAIMATLTVPFVLLFPAWWSMGAWPPPRTVDGIYFVFMHGWFFTIGMITIRFMTRDVPSATSWWYRPDAVVLLAGVLLFVFFAANNSRFMRAWNDFRHHAPAYHEYMQQRHALIERAVSGGHHGLLVPAYQGKPPQTIYFNDIAFDYRDWRNACYADYYGLHTISRQKPPGYNVRKRPPPFQGYQ